MTGSGATRAFCAMGVDVVVGGATAAELGAVERLFADRERTFSRFRPDSELSRVNTARGNVVVTPVFARAVEIALAAASATGGRVDPTLGDAIEAAGYDRDFAEVAHDDGPPGETAVGCWRSVTLAGRLLTRPSAVRLDLNGVVKGITVDESLSLLAGPGFVSAGGDVATSTGFVVGLPAGGSIRLLRGGLATSATTRRRWGRGGGEQHHLIDPRTGRPARVRWTEVTVAAASCLGADVAAKAALLAGDDGPGWLEERGLPGRFVDGVSALENDAWRAVLAVEAAAA